MTQNRTAGRISRTAWIILSILFLWGFGILLLLVILNFGIGFTDNNADFRTAFLSRIEMEECDMVDAYLEMELHNTTENADASEGEPIGLRQNIHTYQAHFDPENTNYRFAATDKDGNLLLTNDPHYGENEPVLASTVRPAEILQNYRTYQIQKHFNHPAEAYFEIAYGTADGYLDYPEDYQLWYFSNLQVDAAYHDGLDATVFSEPYTDYRFFETEEEAKRFEYEAIYGSGCQWEIVTSEEQKEKITLHYGNQTEQSVAVKISAKGEPSDVHISLEQYYEMKRDGKTIHARDAAFEDILTSGLDITIRAQHQDMVSCYIRSYLPENMPIKDAIRSNYAVFSLLFQHSEWSAILMFVMLVLTVISCIAMCSAAVEEAEHMTEVTGIHKMAYEIFWLIPPVMLAAAYDVFTMLVHLSSPYRIIVIFGTGMILCIAASIVLWLYTTAVRSKTGTFWSGFGMIRLLLLFFGMFRSRTFTSAAMLLTAVVLFILNGLILPHTGSDIFAWFIVGLDFLTLLAVSYCIYAYFELHRHVSEMEKGNFEPAKHPVPLGADFGAFDRSLNDITSKVGEIVEQQTKAEHMRTELITNVSHDLKTPLTSIVNYVDLLSREPMQTETAAEYLDVLRRQAARLKKLTIDLVDASKASTGNISVELMPTDIQVLLSQLAGEYEGILAEKDLSLILNVPEKPLMILADGRQIWRVFDNLLNNVSKYALTGTRVYLDVREQDENVVISVKNISAQPLNVSAEELMERFVRGDASRHTEGSGLGLSIARDLTVLQNGVMRLSTDGDLFKAHLTFPLYRQPETESAPEALPEEPEMPQDSSTPDL